MSIYYKVSSLASIFRLLDSRDVTQFIVSHVPTKNNEPRLIYCPFWYFVNHPTSSETLSRYSLKVERLLKHVSRREVSLDTEEDKN